MPFYPDTAIIHYAEIALKGKNRVFFEKALLSNIEAQTAGFYTKIQRISGRIIASFDFQKRRDLQNALAHVFGVHHIFFGGETNADMESMKQRTREMFADIRTSSFAVRAVRSEKTYPFTSQDIEIEVGRVIHEEYAVPVSLNHPEITLFVEITQGRAFMSLERLEGLGGLPVGASGKVVSLLSNGFDSPVAALLMMKRGCVPELIHFHSYPYTSKDASESVEKLRDIISLYSPYPLRFNMVPFSDIQTYIVEHVPSPIRVVLYRRWMLWIAERLAEKVGAHALLTGDSVGQVASQTLENIRTISEIATLPILRPLAGADKEEIISLSKKYGTHDISKLPFDDCCSLFMEGSPATHAAIEEIKKYENPIRSVLENRARQALQTIFGGA